jgi:hypothetical protein
MTGSAAELLALIHEAATIAHDYQMLASDFRNTDASKALLATRAAAAAQDVVYWSEEHCPEEHTHREAWSRHVNQYLALVNVWTHQ